MKSINTDEEYDKLNKKIQNLFTDGMPNGIRSILAHKFVQLIIIPKIKK